MVREGGTRSWRAFNAMQKQQQQKSYLLCDLSRDSPQTGSNPSPPADRSGGEVNGSGQHKMIRIDGSHMGPPTREQLALCGGVFESEKKTEGKCGREQKRL